MLNLQKQALIEYQRIGAVFLDGFKQLIEIVIMRTSLLLDACSTHNLKTVNFMVKKINEGYEVVIGSYFTIGEIMIGVPFFYNRSPYDHQI